MLLRTWVAGCLLAALPAWPAQAQCLGADPEDPPVSVGVPTLVVSLAAERPHYRPGQVAVLVVDVRVGAPDGPKVEEGTTVHVDVTRRGRLVARLSGTTDAGSSARLRVRVLRSWGPGTVDGTADAASELVPGYDCRAPLVYQSGQTSVSPLLRVTA